MNLLPHEIVVKPIVSEESQLQAQRHRRVGAGQGLLALLTIIKQNGGGGVVCSAAPKSRECYTERSVASALESRHILWRGGLLPR